MVSIDVRARCVSVQLTSKCYCADYVLRALQSNEMSDLRETRNCVKFRFNHKKNSESYGTLKRAFGDDLMIRALTVEL